MVYYEKRGHPMSRLEKARQEHRFIMIEFHKALELAFPQPSSGYAWLKKGLTGLAHVPASMMAGMALVLDKSEETKPTKKPIKNSPK